jgi:hypothetical protein
MANLLNPNILPNDLPANQRFPPTQAAQQQQGQPGMFQQRNVWQFNGSRYFRWLPSFSLQITNGGHLLPNLRAPLTPDQLNQMVKILFSNSTHTVLPIFGSLTRIRKISHFFA